jgi:membrane protease YdiL (CAAX protease family)
LIFQGTPARRVWGGVALLLLLGFAGVLPRAFAEEPAGKAPAAEDAKPEVLSLDDIEKRITRAPWASRVALISRGFAILAGIVILFVGLWLAFDRRKTGGGAPRAARTPPPCLFPPGQAFLLAAIGFLVVPALVMAVFSGVRDDVGFRESALALAIGGLPVALLVVVRRARARMPRVGLPLAVVRGLEGFCVATVFVVPAGLLTMLLMDAMGQKPAAQELVSMMLTTEDESIPWTLLVFGVLIAPFTEEAIFRGLLYPAIRDAGPAGRAGAIRAAILVSGIFAVVHRSATAALGLFCLALVLTWIYERTNSLLAIVITHGTNNLLSLVPLLLARHGI